jgi:hypothetical protein
MLMQNKTQKSDLEKLTPLLSIFAMIAVMTIVTSYFQGDVSLMNIMMLSMAYFFLVFGLFKVINLKNFASSYMTYDILANRSKSYAFAYPFIEIALGLLYFFYVGGAYRDVFTFIIMTIGAYGVWKALQSASDIPCACLGMVFKVPMTKVTLFENLAMALMALVMIFISLSMRSMVM